MIFIIALAVAFLIYSTAGIFPKMKEAAENKKNILEELGKLKAREDNLTAQVEKLSTPEGIEESIREKFRVVKEGEGLIVIVNDKTDLDQDKGATSGQKIKNFLKRIFPRKVR